MTRRTVCQVRRTAMRLIEAMGSTRTDLSDGQSVLPTTITPSSVSMFQQSKSKPSAPENIFFVTALFRLRHIVESSNRG